MKPQYILNECRFFYNTLHKAENNLLKFRLENNIKNRELDKSIQVIEILKTRLDDIMKIVEADKSAVYMSNLKSMMLYKYVKN